MLLGLVVVVAGGLVTARRSAGGPGAAPLPRTTQPGASAAAAAEAPTSTLVETLRRKLDVPKGMVPQIIEFGDAVHGYAQFISDEPISRPTEDPATWAYRALIFATRDGGRTWTTLVNPAPPGDSPQLVAVDANTLIISSTSTTGSWVSADGGRTFRRDPSLTPPEMAGMMRGFPVGAYDGKVVVDYFQPTMRPVANQPELPGGGVWAAVQGAGTRLVAASAERAGDTAYTAISEDGGRTWRRLDAPHQDLAGPLDELRLVASRDRADIWLLGYATVPAGGVGSTVRVRKNVGLPVIWRLDGDRWVSKGTVGRPAPKPMDTYSLAPIGGGLIAVAGPHGLALVDDAWTMASIFPRVEWVSTLPDGTVVASAAFGNATVYLGQRSGREVRWTQVTLA